MSSRQTIIAAMAALLVTPAAAQDVTLSWGATLTSNYMSRGATQSDNKPAFQPWAEVRLHGFYAGIWASNVRFPGDPDRDRVEIDLYAGYRFDLGGASFDVGYERYIYNRSGDCCGELYGRVDIEAGSGGAFGGISFDPGDGFRIADANVGVRMMLIEPLSGSAQIGRSYGSNYGNIGVSYAIMPNAEIDLRYHRGTDNRLVASVGVSF